MGAGRAVGACKFRLLCKLGNIVWLSRFPVIVPSGVISVFNSHYQVPLSPLETPNEIPSRDSVSEGMVSNITLNLAESEIRLECSDRIAKYGSKLAYDLDVLLIWAQ